MTGREFHRIRASSRIDAFCIATATSMVNEMQDLLDEGVIIDDVAAHSKSTALSGFTEIVSLPFLFQPAACWRQPLQADAFNYRLFGIDYGLVDSPN